MTPLQRRELTKRAIRGDQAALCCENESSRVNGQISRILSELLNALDQASSDPNLALIIAPAPAIQGITLRAVPAGGPLALGAIVIASAAQLINWAGTAAAYEMLAVTAQAIGQMFGTRTTDCYRCVKQRAFSQAAPRQRQTVKILRRV